VPGALDEDAAGFKRDMSSLSFRQGYILSFKVMGGIIKDLTAFDKDT
jgi:hypothetical protein